MRSIPILSSLVWLAAALAAVTSTAAAQSGAAQPSTWAGGFDLQATIDAAPDGGVVLVPPGQYDPFTVDGKGLTLVASGAALVTIGDPSLPHDPFDDWVAVRNIPAGSEVRLCGFTLRVPQGNLTAPLVLQDCSGPVALIGLQLEDDYGFSELVRVERCASVSFSDCRVLGYDRDLLGFDPPYVTPKAALVAREAFVFLTGCVWRGMDAAPLTGFSSPVAGAAVSAQDSTVVITACELSGGDGQLSGSPQGVGAGGAGGDFNSCVVVVAGEPSMGLFGGQGEASGVLGGVGADLQSSSTLRLGDGPVLLGGVDLGGQSAPDTLTLVPNQLVLHPTALPALTLSPSVIQPGGTINVRIHGERLTNRILWFSLGQVSPTPIPELQSGLSVLDASAFQLAAFMADLEGLVAFPFPLNATGIEGLSFVIQSIEVIGPNTWNISSPAFVAVGP